MITLLNLIAMKQLQVSGKFDLMLSRWYDRAGSETQFSGNTATIDRWWLRFHADDAEEAVYGGGEQFSFHNLRLSIKKFCCYWESLLLNYTIKFLTLY